MPALSSTLSLFSASLPPSPPPYQSTYIYHRTRTDSHSIHEWSPVSASETYDKKRWARLWKSIILSSIGLTAYPYCTYMRSLSLGSYGSLLEDIASDREIRPWLFDALDNTEQFLALRENQQLKKKTRNQPMPFIDFQSTMIRCGELVTQRIQQLAEQTSTAVALTHLEGIQIPANILPTWIIRLPSLVSLQLQDGSVLNAEAASAIHEFCPRFGELSCLSCPGEGIDDNMACFLRGLKPNTLRRFEMISYNELGERSLTALNAHAESLRVLRLSSLSADAMRSLNALPSCTALESLNIENRRQDQVDLATGSEALLKEITTWIRSCKNLQELTLSDLHDAIPILKDVLSTPDIQLNTLDVQGFSSHGEADCEAWAALGLQESLESLTIGGLDGMVDGLIVHESPPLADSICKLTGLKSLNLTRAFVRTIELRKMVMALPGLTDLSFGGDWIDDQILESISRLGNLKALLVNAFSVFTYGGLQEFARKLDPEGNRGITVDINNQLGNWKLDPSDENSLSEYFSAKLGGKIEIGLFNDPDEVHESDFSVTSD